MEQRYGAGQDKQIAAIRQFNRFYTRRIGVLEQHLFDSAFTLTEARVLFELAQRGDALAKNIGAELGLDPGYLSRIVQAFAERGLITRKPVASDRRQFKLALTAKGKQTYSRLERASQQAVGEMIARLTGEDRQRLVDAMTRIERLLGDEAPRPEVTLRTHGPGDIGWIVQQHGVCYAKEFGWDLSFEALCADIAGQFLKNFDPARERCWIAEIDGRKAGSVFLMKHSDETAKIRLLLVDPAGRGLGVGKRLVDECIAFAREGGYRTITLWTHSILIAARGIYDRAGFKLVATAPHRSFGQDLIGETWELKLGN